MVSLLAFMPVVVCGRKPHVCEENPCMYMKHSGTEWYSVCSKGKCNFIYAGGSLL